MSRLLTALLPPYLLCSLFSPFHSLGTLLFVQVWNAFYMSDEFVGHTSIDFSVLRLQNGAMLLSGMRWYQLDEGGEIQLSLLFVEEAQEHGQDLEYE